MFFCCSRENLKLLFRPISLYEIDVKQAVTIALHASGFKNAPEIASKMVTLFRLCEEMLSMENRYDFSLRSVKTILRMVTKTMNENENVEEKIILNAINDYILCKLNIDDAKTFSVSDHF